MYVGNSGLPFVCYPFISITITCPLSPVQTCREDHIDRKKRDCGNVFVSKSALRFMCCRPTFL